MQMRNLVGLGVDEAVKILNDLGVDFRLTFYGADKRKDFDTQLIIAVRDTVPMEIIVGDFKFNVDTEVL